MHGNGNIDQCNEEKQSSCMWATYFSTLLPINYPTNQQHEMTRFKVLTTTEAHNSEFLILYILIQEQ